MSPRGALVFSLLLALAALTFASFQTSAQTLRTHLQKPADVLKAPETAWSAGLYYSLLSDYADNRMPRAYDHALGADVRFQISKEWSVGASVGGKAQLINGQVDKGEEQTYSETLSPYSEFALNYEHKLAQHSIGLGIIGSPLWDEPSRREGQSAFFGASGDLNLSFFDKIYSMGHSVGVGSLINSYRYGSDGQPNPDYFYNYSFSNSLKFWDSYRISYVFGFKTTRYLDGYWGYGYSNGFRLSKQWHSVTVALGYENGGFTNDGDVHLWYIDQYRRIGKLGLAYEF